MAPCSCVRLPLLAAMVALPRLAPASRDTFDADSVLSASQDLHQADAEIRADYASHLQRHDRGTTTPKNGAKAKRPRKKQLQQAQQGTANGMHEELQKKFTWRKEKERLNEDIKAGYDSGEVEKLLAAIKALEAAAKDQGENVDSDVAEANALVSQLIAAKAPPRVPLLPPPQKTSKAVERHDYQILEPPPDWDHDLEQPRRRAFSIKDMAPVTQPSSSGKVEPADVSPFRSRLANNVGSGGRNTKSHVLQTVEERRPSKQHSHVHEGKQKQPGVKDHEPQACGINFDGTIWLSSGLSDRYVAFFVGNQVQIPESYEALADITAYQKARKSVGTVKVDDCKNIEMSFTEGVVINGHLENDELHWGDGSGDDEVWKRATFVEIGFDSHPLACELGLLFAEGHTQDNFLKIAAVTGGLVQKWNREHPDEPPVAAGDDVVTIDGLAGLERELRQRLESDAGVARLLVVGPVDKTDAGVGDSSRGGEAVATPAKQRKPILAKKPVIVQWEAICNWDGEELAGEKTTPLPLREGDIVTVDQASYGGKSDWWWCERVARRKDDRSKGFVPKAFLRVKEGQTFTLVGFQSSKGLNGRKVQVEQWFAEGEGWKWGVRETEARETDGKRKGFRVPEKNLQVGPYIRDPKEFGGKRVRVMVETVLEDYGDLAVRVGDEGPVTRVLEGEIVVNFRDAKLQNVRQADFDKLEIVKAEEPKPPWSIAQSIQVSESTAAAWKRLGFERLDETTYASRLPASKNLKKNPQLAPRGFCLMKSKSQEHYFVMYRSDKLIEAQQAIVAAERAPLPQAINDVSPKKIDVSPQEQEHPAYSVLRAHEKPTGWALYGEPAGDTKPPPGQYSSLNAWQETAKPPQERGSGGRAPLLPPEEFVAMYNFDAREGDQISFNTGDIIVITKKEGDWWTGRKKRGEQKKSGLVPSNYLKKKA